MTDRTATWDDLGRELSAWAESGRTAGLWWRDDDATVPGPALARLLTLAHRVQAPLGLAVIPENAAPALSGHLAHEAGVRVLVHGWAHTNHAPEGEKKQELGFHRPAETVLAELARGLETLRSWPGALPVLVPPWNRIADAVSARLGEAGFAGLSVYGPRPAAEAGPAALRVVNAHVDVVDWKAGRRFVGEGRALGLLVGHLHDRRAGSADADEATGLLTHHAVHDDETWTFLETLTETVGAHAGARWCDPADLFATPPAALAVRA